MSGNIRYAELQCTSHFSFLRGASSCQELFDQAAKLGIEALAITDRNSLAGIIRAHVAAKESGVRLIVGCRLDLADGMSLLVYPTDRAAYGRLCRLLTIGNKRGGKANCILNWSDVVEWGEGMIAVLVPDEADDVCGLYLRKLAECFGNRAYMTLTLRRRPNDQLRLHNLSNLAALHRVPTIVSNDVLFHEPSRRILQDVVTCIRNRCTIDDAGFRRERHADRYMKPPEEMARLFPRYQEAVRRTLDLADRCRFSLDELKYQYPKEQSHPELTPQQTLEKLAWEGAKDRYPEGIPDKVIGIIKHELGLIEALEYAPYFLTVNSIVRFARSQDILCQGRGSAANSAVCYVLGITSIDPERNDLLFERFVSMERHEPPDIDVDFEHERREIVLQWVFETYGRDHAALCCTVRRYRTKSAFQDIGKVLGLPQDVIASLSENMWGSRDDDDDDKVPDIHIKDRRIRLVLALATQLRNAPKYLSQHPGGFVLTHDRLDEFVPIEPAAKENRQVIVWDKDDIEAVRFMKVDCLALGMLTCMKRGLDFLKEVKGIELNLATIPAEDPRTYAMIRKADTLGTFQIESRAQMSMLPRLKPRTFYDLVIEVAIVRPGPIQGDMVHPYIARRNGLEKVEYPKPELEKVLGKTLGVPLFQEQAMRVAIECAGFTPGEADQLRRSMATFKHTGGVHKYHDMMINGMVANGYDVEFAERMFRQLEGFGSYGFPESHAASFALIAYASAWVKCWHPEVFCASLINSLPMGFYAPAQIAGDARKHGVEVRPVCVNASRWDCTLEPTKDEGRFAVRLGFRIINGLVNKHAAQLIAARHDQPFSSVDDLWRRAKVPAGTLALLAEADTFYPSFKLVRRDAQWAVKALRDEPLPLFAAASLQAGETLPEVIEPVVKLRPMTKGNEVVEDYKHLSLTLRSHPVSFLREGYNKQGFSTCTDAMNAKDGKYVQVAGMVLVRQMPGTAKGVVFVTIEDETGIANIIVWPKVYETYRRVVLTSGMMLISGQIQKEGEVVHLIARSIADFSSDLASVGERDEAFPLPHNPGDEFRHGEPGPDPRTLPSKSARPEPSEAIRIRSRDFR